MNMLTPYDNDIEMLKASLGFSNMTAVNKNIDEGLKYIKEKNPFYSKIIELQAKREGYIKAMEESKNGKYAVNLVEQGVEIGYEKAKQERLINEIEFLDYICKELKYYKSVFGVQDKVFTRLCELKSQIQSIPSKCDKQLSRTENTQEKVSVGVGVPLTDSLSTTEKSPVFNLACGRRCGIGNVMRCGELNPYTNKSFLCEKCKAKEVKE